MAHKVPDGSQCNNYFKYGKSFPENVEDALCQIPYGATGPTGPAGPSGKGVSNVATTADILAGNNTLDPCYVNAAGWYESSNQYAPLVYTTSIENETYTPDALEYNIFDITVNGTCSIAAPTNMKNGRTISLVLRQGGLQMQNTISWDPIFHFDGGYNSLTYTAGSKDVVTTTMVNDFCFTTMANDCKSSISDSSLI